MDGNGTALNQSANEIIRRIEFGRQAGMQYGGDRDLYTVGGYPRSLTWSHFWSMYERDPIAGRLVDMVAETTWRQSPTIEEPGATNPTEFMDESSALFDRLGVWSRMERVDKLARVGRYAVLLIGTPDGDLTTLRDPITAVGGPDDILFLQPFAEVDATINTWVVEPTDARYGLPETYRIDLSGGISEFRGATRAVGSVVVHASRCIHVAENLLRDEVYGRSVLQRCFNDLMDLQKVTCSTAEAYWQRVAGILGLEIDPMAKLSDAELTALDTSMQELYHDLRRYFFAQGAKLYRVADTEPDPGPAARLAMQRIAASEGIPFRMLVGNETGERASTEDTNSYLASITERRTTYATPLLRAVIERLQEINGLPRAGREGYDVVWPSLFPESELETAQANKARADVAAALAGPGGMPLDLVEIDPDRNVWLRPTGERGELTPDELNPPEPEPLPMPPPEPGEGAPEVEPAS